MRVLESVEIFRSSCDDLRRQSRQVGLVPTMGALHDGHASLIRRARQDGCAVALTIFVNPTQFGPNEDFQKYPRTLERDLELASREGVELVFAPTVAEMYPRDESTRVVVRGMTDGLCGASRPGHFDGVATIVTKLFAAAGPCTAFFGQKDYQQYRVIERMARDLLLPVRVVGCPIVREADGLAMSSRNRYLSPSERVQALAISQGLAMAAAAFRSRVRVPAEILALVRDSLGRAGLREDYVALREPSSLDPLEEAATLPERVLVAVAAFCGRTRLIDNMVLGDEDGPSRGGVP